ncbi:MAG: hypothetical protein AVDCRST_MAG91-562 [uncultured Sphingomonadaceae bacterium]|uniref:Uncharacterized protein n=1 Tax=uncultured Sphingomonadaceae bacterium TaxID=169976 RepID=A0A6J4SEF0_9SPHN|nr:MAG: hypothetical protein AVDCRST_MAG91-562 [uncultured Sphingomonadaceae bacterium]
MVASPPRVIPDPSSSLRGAEGDAAIHSGHRSATKMDCFAALAMTARWSRNVCSP